ncbi:MAG TPA: diguanylate cyclase [Solirubrobacteraceae bacterium]
MPAPFSTPDGPERPPGRRRADGVRALVERLRRRQPRLADADLPGILDLFEELMYAGEITPDGHYVHHSGGPTLERFLGGQGPDDVEGGRFWESRIHPEDAPSYDAFNQRLLSGADAEVTYRLIGLDGVTRILWDRARPRRRSDGTMLVHGIVSDITRRREADARLEEVRERFTHLLDVTGEHVYLALAHPGGRIEELFQGPGADRLLGGAEPDPEMTNWEAALHPDDRAAYDAFNAALAEGREADVEYRLRGADGVTRWVHDRAATRLRADGTYEISGIVSDVTERRRMRAELADAHAALSRVVEAMDDHLYTLRIEDDGTPRTVYRGPNREALLGGPLTGGNAGDDRLWETLVHPDDRERRAAAIARLRDGDPVELEYRVVGLDGRERTVLDALRPRRAPDGTLSYDGVTRDVTERRRLENELHRAHSAAEMRARTDELTGASNRRHFAEIVEEALAADPGGCALLLLDADHFKQVNDLHGHVVGDAVLVELARRLAGGLRPTDTLARWGGEEFAVLLRGVKSDEELDRLAQRLRSSVSRMPVSADGVTIRLTVSIGAARAGGALKDLDGLVEAADCCLYVAKRQGRDRVSLVPDIVEADAPDSDAVHLARALALTAARREGEPETHAEQVAALATQTADRMALPIGVVERCTLGGWLHDVGKVAVPDRILGKPGPLDDDEWNVMRTHPLVGAEIVVRVGSLSEAAPAVRHHHERFDGSGYPDGLAGDAIPIEARIVAAADAYAAMTADRVHAPAREPRDAVRELRDSCGSHLDPDVVTALLDVLGFGERADLRVVA